MKTEEIKDKIFEIVREMQPVTAKDVCTALKETYGIQISVEETREHMERLRSSFPTKLAHAGPDRYHLIELE